MTKPPFYNRSYRRVDEPTPFLPPEVGLVYGIRSVQPAIAKHGTFGFERGEAMRSILDGERLFDVTYDLMPNGVNDTVTATVRLSAKDELSAFARAERRMRRHNKRRKAITKA